MNSERSPAAVAESSTRVNSLAPTVLSPKVPPEFRFGFNVPFDDVSDPFDEVNDPFDEVIDPFNEVVEAFDDIAEAFDDVVGPIR